MPNSQALEQAVEAAFDQLKSFKVFDPNLLETPLESSDNFTFYINDEGKEFIKNVIRGALQEASASSKDAIEFEQSLSQLTLSLREDSFNDCNLKRRLGDAGKSVNLFLFRDIGNTAIFFEDLVGGDELAVDEELEDLLAAFDDLPNALDLEAEPPQPPPPVPLEGHYHNTPPPRQRLLGGDNWEFLRDYTTETGDNLPNIKRNPLSGCFIADFYPQSERGDEKKIKTDDLGKFPVKIFSGKGADVEFQKVIQKITRENQGLAEDGKSYPLTFAIVAVEIGGRLDYRLVTYNTKENAASIQYVSKKFLEENFKEEFENFSSKEECAAKFSDSYIKDQHFYTIAAINQKAKEEIRGGFLQKINPLSKNSENFNEFLDRGDPPVNLQEHEGNSSITISRSVGKNGTRNVYITAVNNASGDNVVYLELLDKNNLSVGAMRVEIKDGKAVFDFKNVYLKNENTGKFESQFGEKASKPIPKDVRQLMNNTNVKATVITREADNKVNISTGVKFGANEASIERFGVVEGKAININHEKEKVTSNKPRNSPLNPEALGAKELSFGRGG